MLRKTGKRKVTKEYLNETSDVCLDNYTVFIGIDPSFSATGFVILTVNSDTPVVATTIKAGSSSDFFHKRLKILLDKLKAYMVQYPTGSIHVVMEGASFASEFNAFKLGKLSGVVEYFLGELGIDYHLVAPTYAKQVAAGNGAASKQAVMHGVKSRWGFSTHNDNIADAYTLAQIAKGEKPLPKTK